MRILQVLQEALDVSLEGPTAGQAPPLACGGGVVRRRGFAQAGQGVVPLASYKSRSQQFLGPRSQRIGWSTRSHLQSVPLTSGRLLAASLSSSSVLGGPERAGATGAAAPAGCGPRRSTACCACGWLASAGGPCRAAVDATAAQLRIVAQTTATCGEGRWRRRRSRQQSGGAAAIACASSIRALIFVALFRRIGRRATGAGAKFAGGLTEPPFVECQTLLHTDAVDGWFKRTAARCSRPCPHVTAVAAAAACAVATALKL